MGQPEGRGYEIPSTQAGNCTLPDPGRYDFCGPATAGRANHLLGPGLTPVLGYPDAEELSKEWAVQDRGAVKKVDKQLASMGLSIDAPTAHALAMRIDQFERIERMIMNAEARRNAALREVDRHRASLAQALREASDDVIEAEFEDVPAQQHAQEDAA